MLEIGSGWGELAIRAAERGAHVTILTISPSQWATASLRVAAAGAAGRVDVQLRDYREATGRYDVVLSVEMIEAVGERYWPVCFAAIDRLLAPGGRAGLQAITRPHDRMLATRGGHTWIHKYIFPGGQIPPCRRSVTSCVPIPAWPSARTSRWASTTRAPCRSGGGGFWPPLSSASAFASSACGTSTSPTPKLVSGPGYLDVHQLLLDRGQMAGLGR